MKKNLERLFSKTQLIDDLTIPIHFMFLEVGQKPLPLPYQLEQSPPGMMVPFVGLEVLCEISDPFAEKRDLNLC